MSGAVAPGGRGVGGHQPQSQQCLQLALLRVLPGARSVRGKAPEIDIAQLEDELRGFLGDLVHGDWMARFVPEGLRVIRDIAFSGNGEPTSASVFPSGGPGAALAGRVRPVAHRGAVATDHQRQSDGAGACRRACACWVRRAEEVWFKVDGGTAEAIERINGVRLEPESVARNLVRCAQLCPTWGEDSDEVCIATMCSCYCKPNTGYRYTKD